MKIRVEFEEAHGAQRIEEATDFLVFWRDVDGHIAWTSTGWDTLDIAEAIAVASENAPQVPIQ